MSTKKVEKKSPVIGIDLGTTNSCVAVFRNRNVEIIANSHGNRTTPSCVAFENGRQLVGEDAKKKISSNPKNTIFDFKRLIGRKYNDPTVQSDIKQWSFKVINDTFHGLPQIVVDVNNNKQTYYTEQIASKVLFTMKKTAERYLNEKITHAVITVPANFNDAQRQATKDAAAIAGLTVLRIINEPTAAAIAYGLTESREVRNILVYDLGGGTCDVTILTIKGRLFEVIATAGHTHLGGSDFDKRLAGHFIEEFKSKNKIVEAIPSSSITRLTVESEKAKRELSTQAETEVKLSSFHEGLN